MTLTEEEGDYLLEYQGFGYPRWSMLFRALCGSDTVHNVQIEEINALIGQNPSEYVSTLSE